MKEKWSIEKIIGLLLGIIALACFIISMFQEENKTFLIIGLVCNCISLILFLFINKNKQ